MFWNNDYVPNADALFDRLKEEAVKVPQPEVLIRGDLAGRYESIGKAVFACQRAGIQKIGFVTEPPARN
jgi:biopolymer transport protein ExbD